VLPPELEPSGTGREAGRTEAAGVGWSLALLSHLMTTRLCMMYVVVILFKLFFGGHG
jgi:hypothetical protein